MTENNEDDRTTSGAGKTSGEEEHPGHNKPIFEKTINLGEGYMPGTGDQESGFSTDADSMEESPPKGQQIIPPHHEDEGVPDENRKVILTEDDYADLGSPSEEGSGREGYLETAVVRDLSIDTGEIDRLMENQANEASSSPSASGKEATPPFFPARAGNRDALPKESPEEEVIASAVPSAKEPRSHAGLATALGLMAMIAAAGALWMNFGLSDRVTRLDARLSQIQISANNQRRAIASINRRLDVLTDTLSAQTAMPPPATVKKSPPTVKSPASPPASKPEVKGPTVIPLSSASDSGSGAWVVNLTSLSSAAAARREVARLGRLGIHAESVRAKAQGKIWYRIRVPGFASASEAKAQSKALENRLDIQDTWIGKK